MFKVLERAGLGRTDSMIKAMTDKLTDSVTLNGENSKYFH